MDELKLVTSNSLQLENEERLKSTIAELHSKYDKLVVSDETQKDVKKVVAELRKGKKEINDNRIAIKKRYEKPLEAFTKKVNGYVSDIDGIISNLSGQLYELEQSRIEKKKAAINSLIDEMKQNYNFDEPVDLNGKWLNKTYSMKKIAEDIKAQIKQAKRDNSDWELVKKYAVNNGVNAEYYRAFIGVYTVFDIQKMIDDDVSEMQKQRKELQKEQKRNLVDINGEVKSGLQEVSFTVRGTQEQLDDLAKYITANDMVITNHSSRKNVLGGKN